MGCEYMARLSGNHLEQVALDLSSHPTNPSTLVTVHFKQQAFSRASDVDWLFFFLAKKHYK